MCASKSKYKLFNGKVKKLYVYWRKCENNFKLVILRYYYYTYEILVILTKIIIPNLLFHIAKKIIERYIVVYLDTLKINTVLKYHANIVSKRFPC